MVNVAKYTHSHGSYGIDINKKTREHPHSGNLPGEPRGQKTTWTVSKPWIKRAKKTTSEWWQRRKAKWTMIQQLIGFVTSVHVGQEIPGYRSYLLFSKKCKETLVGGFNPVEKY